MTAARRAFVLACVLALASCAFDQRARTADTLAPARPPPLEIDVDVAWVADENDRVGAATLSYCPRGDRAWPRRLAPENRRAVDALVSAHDEEGRTLDVGADGVRTLGLRGCARLVVDLASLADAARDKDVALRIGGDLVATPDVWLWRPDPFPDEARLFVRLVRGPFQTVTPWRVLEGDRFVVDASTFQLHGNAAIGRFTTRSIDVPGATLDVTALGEEAPPAQFLPWLVESAGAVASLSGKFPVPRLAVLVCAQPAPRPVLVGYFSRGGGPLALFFVSSQATDVDSDDHERTGRWALTHELAHAWLPPVAATDAWFNEGLATWHQDLLARRARIIASDEDYWRALLRGLDTGAARARDDGLSLEQASTRMRDEGSYQHVYWAGVALLLLAEVEARQQGASIDDVVLFLRRRFPLDDAPRDAVALLAVAEQEAGPISIAARAWRGAFDRFRGEPFPDTSAALRDLGVRRGDKDALVLDDDAPLAFLRHALTASVPTS